MLLPKSSVPFEGLYSSSTEILITGLFVLFRALQFPPEAWLRISLNHASLTWIHIRPDGRVGIRSMGEAGHMPANKISVL